MKGPTLRGFYYYYGRKCNTPQRRLFLKALARLARQFPDVDPRQAILEHLISWVTRYEQFIEETNFERTRHHPWLDERRPEDIVRGFMQQDEYSFEEMRGQAEGDKQMDRFDEALRQEIGDIISPE